MLILSRKPGESIIIGDNIRAVVLSVKDDQVKLGVDADKSISIHRKEAYVKMLNKQKKVKKKEDSKD